ncbi:MAG: NAD(P)-dependent oxidoreductase [Firmicutes bacterium HGW-Firmicutes-16]|nr:MAG: NAD(P)-dependent oxidoreductase [Firmicutes bacterium HGW-Firmicutes-16]
MGKILVTGAQGNVGAYVAQYAISNGEQVKVASRGLKALETQYVNSAECIYFDFTDSSSFNAALDGVDRVFIVRPPQLGAPEDLKPFIEAMKNQGGIKLVSFLSLIGVEKNPAPPHHKIEKYIEQAKLPYCHIRPSFFMQNISGIHAFEIKHFDRIIVPVKNALTSFIDTEDIGFLVAKILSESEKHQNKAYSITGPEAISYWQVERILSEELGRKITYANPQPLFAKKYWTDVRGIDKEYSNVMGMLYMMTRLGTAKKITSTFEEVTGRKPQAFRQFVKKNLNAWER